MAYLVNTGLNALKWPAALLMVILLLPLTQALLTLVTSLFEKSGDHQLLFIGFLSYGMVLLIFGKSRLRNLLHTFNHELIHTIVAVLTLNRVTHLYVTAQKGGAMQYEGKGNWLITIAPYFLPLPMLIVVGFMLAVKSTFYPVLLVTLGFLSAYQLFYIKCQIHPAQTDLKQVGWLFALLFLPGANLFFITLVLVLIPNDQFFADAYFSQLQNELVKQILNIWVEFRQWAN